MCTVQFIKCAFDEKLGILHSQLRYRHEQFYQHFNRFLKFNPRHAVALQNRVFSVPGQIVRDTINSLFTQTAISEWHSFQSWPTFILFWEWAEGRERQQLETDPIVERRWLLRVSDASGFKRKLTAPKAIHPSAIMEDCWIALMKQTLNMPNVAIAPNKC